MKNHDQHKNLTIEAVDFDDVDRYEDLSADQRRFLRLYAASREDAVEGSLPALDADAMVELSDDIRGQSNAVLRDDEGKIVAVVSYDLNRPSGAFLEGLAVDPSVRRSGYGRTLAAYAIDQIATAGFVEAALRSQPSSLVANQRLVDSLGYEAKTSDDAHYPKMIVYLKSK